MRVSKFVAAMTLGLICGVNVVANAEVIYVDDASITEVSVYDDWNEGVVIVGLSKSTEGCVNAYLNPTSAGFDRLYSLVLAAATTKQSARFQLYDDRKLGDRCEIDAIRIFY